MFVRNQNLKRVPSTAEFNLFLTAHQDTPKRFFQEPKLTEHTQKHTRPKPSQTQR